MLRSTLDDILDHSLQDRRLLEHPFYRRWEAGELHPAELAAYGAQYRHFEALLPDVLAAAVEALPDGRARELVQANLDDERGTPEPHLSLFDEFATAVGAPCDEPVSAAMAALVASYGAAARNPATALAAVAAYEVQAPAIARSKAEGLRLRYGLTTAQTRFWDVHGTMDEDHAAWTLDALAALPADEQTVRTAARTAADAWWSFLDERQEAAAALGAG